MRKRKRQVTLTRSLWGDWENKSRTMNLCSQEMVKLFRIPKEVQKIRFWVYDKSFEGAREYALVSREYQTRYMSLKSKRGKRRYGIPSWTIINWLSQDDKTIDFYKEQRKPIFIKMEILETK